MGSSAQPDAAYKLKRAYSVLGLYPGVSPLKARARYRELIKKWHPDRFSGDPAGQAEATGKTQEINESYRTIKNAVRHHEVPVRPPRQADVGAERIPNLAVETLGDRFVRFVGGVVIGLLIAFGSLADSVTVWVVLPLAIGTLAAAFGGRILEWALWALWWLP